MRDVSLLFCIADSYASILRKRYEEKHHVSLPHPGTLHDMGSCVTHKYQIIYKSVVEKKDPLRVARETNHTVKAVDRYLKDFNRVKTLYIDNKDENYIHLVTNLFLGLIAQYISIIKEYL